MVKNALKMSKWFSVLVALSSITISTCKVNLVIVQRAEFGFDVPVPSTIEAIAGSSLSLVCTLQDSSGAPWDSKLVWGRRSKELRFKNETDLLKLAKEGSKELYDLLDDYEPFITFNKAIKHFKPLKVTDRGAYFCGSLKYKLFKIVHIKVKEKDDNRFDFNFMCKKDQFRCLGSGICINLHYKCDGKSDCYDGSDESWFVCNGNPCEGKIQCTDGRCIPTAWCCNKHTDDNCAVAVRPTCCPPVPDPYDPIHYYNDQKAQEVPKSNGPRYLFVTICVVSAILSFVLFLFIISKVCGFDAKPNRPRIVDPNSSRNQTTTSTSSNRCEHSECAIRREFNPNSICLYQTTTSDPRNLSSDNNNEVVDPLIAITTINTRGSPPAEIFDLPPPYAEVVTSPPSIDKCLLDDLTNAPPPPYSSTKYFTETEIGNGNNVRASDYTNNTSNNYCNNQSGRCDINATSDRNSRVY